MINRNGGRPGPVAQEIRQSGRQGGKRAGGQAGKQAGRHPGHDRWEGGAATQIHPLPREDLDVQPLGVVRFGSSGRGAGLSLNLLALGMP